MIEPEIMEFLLKNHLQENNLLLKDKAWCVRYSKLGGRGLFASRNISQGEIIFTDSPLIIGPRCYKKYLPMCINCYKSGCPLFSCDHGCGLPICSNKCENSKEHKESECKYLQKWQVSCGSMWSMDLLQTVVPIRGLSLTKNQKKLLESMECHQGSRHGQEIDILKKNILAKIDMEDEKLMLRICQVFDTNAFETVKIVDGFTSISLRGLFPLGALQNHSCTPNTRHYFISNGFMVTRASLAINAGEELTMTYTDLLWDTLLRRRYLFISKHFQCSCKRCSDPMELNSNLAALRCANINCYGTIFPDNPLNFNSVWICHECKRKVSSRQITVIRSGIKSIVDQILFEHPRKILKFIETELNTLVPSTNHLIMDMKFRIISYFGRTDDLKWNDLTDKELEIKEKYCNDLLNVLEKLDLGDHQKKGLILYELYCTKCEQLSRKEEKTYDDELLKNKNILKKVLDILKDDISAPSDLKNI